MAATLHHLLATSLADAVTVNTLWNITSRIKKKCEWFLISYQTTKGYFCYPAIVGSFICTSYFFNLVKMFGTKFSLKLIIDFGSK